MKKTIFISILVGSTLALWLMIRALPLEAWSHRLADQVQNFGAAGVLVFFVIYILAVLFLIPTPLLTFAAGLAYGFWGLPLVIASASAASIAPFFLARHFAFEAVEKMMNKRASTRALRKAIEIEGWRFLILLRISPLIPFSLNNYFLGTAPVRFKTYVWVTALGTLPGTALYTCLAVVGKSLQEGSIFKWILFTAGLVTLSFLIKMTANKTKQILVRQGEL